MALLVEFVCTECGGRSDQWVRVKPIPSVSSCTVCGAPARRRFGGRLLAGRSVSPPPAAADRRPRRDSPCGDHETVPAACSLVPSAARMLAARVRGDRRALDSELAHQEAEISAGRLDPGAPVVEAYPGAQRAAPGNGRSPRPSMTGSDKHREKAE